MDEEEEEEEEEDDDDDDEEEGNGLVEAEPAQPAAQQLRVENWGSKIGGDMSVHNIVLGRRRSSSTSDLSTPISTSSTAAGHMAPLWPLLLHPERNH
jgi:hypothetical protein